MMDVAIVLRILHLGAAIILVGSCTFILLVVRPALSQSSHGDWPAWPCFDRVVLRAGCWSLVGLVSTGVLGLWEQWARVTQHARVTAAFWDSLHAFLTDTYYGRTWVLRMLLAAALGGVLLRRRHLSPGTPQMSLRLVGAILACGLLVSQGLTGHAAAAEGMEWLVQGGVAVLHLLGAGVWLGSLPWLAVLLTWLSRANQASTEHLAAAITRRFSALGLSSVLVLIVTGLVRAWILVGSVPALIGTPYGQLLLGKVGLLFFLLIPAGVNLWQTKPYLLRMVAAQRRPQIRAALLRLRRHVTLEAVGGLALLCLVGGLGVYAPARHVSPHWPLSFRLSWYAGDTVPGITSDLLRGGTVALLGLLAAGWAGFSPRWRWPVAGGGVIGLLYGLWVILQTLAVEAYPTTYVRPTVPYEALSIANGLRLYETHCVVCHGSAGYGDGPAAATLRPLPADLTALHTAHHTAGDFFWWLTYGIKGSAMPGFEDRLSAEERWDVINFVRALAAAERARTLGPRLEATPWLVAPDVSYVTPEGEGRTLKDHRGQQSVLLVFFRQPDSQARLAQLHDLAPHLQRLGSTVLTVPLDPDDERSPPLDTSLRFPIVTDGAAEVAMAYTLFCKSLSSIDRLPALPFPSHLEFLIDRQGYIRSRWIRGSGPDWAENAALIAAIEQLNQEKLRAPAPDTHVH